MVQVGLPLILSPISARAPGGSNWQGVGLPDPQCMAREEKSLGSHPRKICIRMGKGGIDICKMKSFATGLWPGILDWGARLLLS